MIKVQNPTAQSLNTEHRLDNLLLSNFQTTAVQDTKYVCSCEFTLTNKIILIIN